jgi:hypothetical protein
VADDTKPDRAWAPREQVKQQLDGLQVFQHQLQQRQPLTSQVLVESSSNTYTFNVSSFLAINRTHPRTPRLELVRVAENEGLDGIQPGIASSHIQSGNFSVQFAPPSVHSIHQRLGNVHVEGMGRDTSSE